MIVGAFLHHQEVCQPTGKDTRSSLRKHDATAAQELLHIVTGACTALAPSNTPQPGSLRAAPAAMAVKHLLLLLLLFVRVCAGAG